MIIIFEKLEPGTRGSANGMWLHGKKEYDNSEYKKFYFDETKDGDTTKLHTTLKGFKAGDRLALEFDDTKFKNLKGVEIATGDPVKKGSGGGGYSGGGGGKGKGNFRNPDHTDRSSAMYLAWDIVAGLAGLKHKAPAKASHEGILAKFQDLAKQLEGFLHTGKFTNGEDDPTPADDQPAPPADDGDDIPF
jgi:hypothetical protein